MASASTTSRKRKRDVKDDADDITWQISSDPESQLGPVLVSYPALEPDKKTPFQCYLRKKPREGEAEEQFAARSTLLVGEASTVEFVSSSENHAGSVGCRYLIGVHDKRTNTMTLRPVPLHVLTRQVKALKDIQPAAVSAIERLQARANLGETFGTKKAKAALRAYERNRVDVSAMEGIAGHLQDSIEQNTAALPTKDEAKAATDQNRLIPPCNTEADDPADVYRLHDIIPDTEWKALSVSMLTAANNEKDRIALLPYKRSKWVNRHLQRLFAAPTLNKHNTKILIYIATMFSFRMAALKRNVEKTWQERLPGVPSIIVDGLVARFTEVARGSQKSQTTSQTETSLMTYMFALMLRLDDYATNTELVADDMSMTGAKINSLFKSLGCKVEKPKPIDLKRLGLSDSMAQTKLAMLKAPPEFPKPRTAPKKRR